jgi:hypothetical protein
MLSQLSYSPTSESNYRWAAGLSKAPHGAGSALVGGGALLKQGRWSPSKEGEVEPA